MTDLSKRLRKMMPQQVCADVLDETANEIDLLEKEAELLRADPAMHYCHRFAILLECLMLSQDLIRYWREAGELLDEYNEAQHQWRDLAGEPYVSGFGTD